MVANLMKVAGVDHVITVDLHASQMQGFFKCPVDNLRAEPLIAKWIRMNIQDWREAVVVSKNPGGTKRVTSLADALQLSFGIITTDRRRQNVPSSMFNSAIFEPIGTDGTNDGAQLEEEVALTEAFAVERATREQDFAEPQNQHQTNGEPSGMRSNGPRAFTTMSPGIRTRLVNGDNPSSPLANSTRASSIVTNDEEPPAGIQRVNTVPGVARAHHDSDGYEESEGEEDVDEVCKLS